jgi:hypothetical protein
MSLFKKVDQVLAAMGNIRAMERLHVDTVAEDKILNIQGNKIAESDEGIIYGGIDDLNGYLFLETVILTRINIKTFKGATLKFTGLKNFELKSDTQEIASEFSNVSNRFITNISFDITKPEIELIRDKQYEKVEFRFKKKSLTLSRTD